ncbi:MAG: histidine phosphatase family protein [Spirochaetia bacterium]|jgi:broad specificity phosphatase PhoE|nr:histidine phosphatase family protein [Spirochaetia bacterium]
MTETKLYLVRHGETVWNREDKMQGIKDSPLTEKGIKHAKILGIKLGSELPGGIDKIYTSSLGRAYETAAIIGNRLSMSVTADDRLQERNMGIFEGYSWDSVRELFPEEFKKTVSDDNDYMIPEGESKNEYIKKVRSFLDFVSQEHEGDKVLAVTHRGFINFALRIILEIPLNARPGITVKNTSLAGFTFHRGRWILETFGEI